MLFEFIEKVHSKKVYEREERHPAIDTLTGRHVCRGLEAWPDGSGAP